MIHLTAADVRRHLSMNDAISLVRETMIRVAEGKANLPLRMIMDIDGTNKLGVMPGALSDPTVYGVKLLSLFPGNPAKGISSHIGVVMLFDSETGAPKVAVDADAITAIRTAAATAAATQALSRSDASTMAIIGTGEQAETHIEAITLVRDITDIHIAGRTPARAEEFIAQIAPKYPQITFVAAPDVQSAVTGADIVCTVTSSQSVILHGDWIGPGCHVNAVGASIPVMQEIDQDLLLKAELFVDYKPSALAQAREIIDALASDAMAESDIRAEIGDLYRGFAPGRSDPKAITLYRSLGIAAQDLACAEFVQHAARRP